MNTKEPEFRCGTRKAADSLIAKFNLLHENWMQDWPYDISDYNKIDEYFIYYDQVTDEDEKFILMELLIQATNDQPKILNFDKYWLELRSRIINDFEIHKYTVHYWSSFENENLELCWTVTPYMRELWIKQNYISRKNKLSSSELAEIIIIELENYNLLLENSFTKTKKVVEEVIDIRKSLNDY